MIFLTKKGFLPNYCCSDVPASFKRSDSFVGFEPIIDSLTKSSMNKPTEFRKLIDDTDREIINLPILDNLSIEQIRYLHVFATFASIKYVWCQGVNNCPKALPNFLGKLWKSTGDQIGLKTTITYASSVLYNWKMCNNNVSPHNELKVEDIECIFSFTNTEDEDNFFKIMVIIEQFCGSIIENYMEIHGLCVLPEQNDVINDNKLKVDRINECLQHINQNMINIYNTLSKFGRKYKCDPYFFYHDLRKYLCGFNDKKIFPNGFLINGVQCDFPGSSGAQSPLFFFLDAMLNINHADNKGKHVKKMMDEAFLCMPIDHQKYISSLEHKLDLDYIIKTCHSKKLTKSYNDIIRIYNRIRSCHYAIVHKYIIKQDPTAIKGTLGSNLKVFLTTIIKNTKNKIDDRFERLEKYNKSDYCLTSVVVFLTLVLVLFFVYKIV